MKIDWTKYFDQIYCIHFLPKHKERINRIEQQLKSVGILDSEIFQWEYTIDTPFYKYMRENANYFHTNLKNSQGAFNCAFAHYCIYKKALSLEYNKILILEEDIVFLHDKNLFAEMLSYTPDSDICLYDKFHGDMRRYIYDLSKQNLRCNKYYAYFDNTCRGFQSSAFYGISQKAMKQFVEEQEKSLHCPDELWNSQGNPNVHDLIRTYALQNLGIQQQFTGSIHKNDVEILYTISNIDKSLYQI